MKHVVHALVALVAAGLGGNATQVHAATCTFGSSGEPSLQTALNGILGAATVNVQTACLADGSDALWNTAGQIGEVDIQVELAGNADSNTLGIYDPVSGNQLQVFKGTDDAGTSSIIRVVKSGGVWQASIMDFDQTHPTWSSTLQLGSSVFGFYLGTSNGTFFSDTGKNTDGVDHMYAYGPLTGNPQFEGEYIQAWEDLAGGGDRDYQDMVVSLADISPVPLPAAGWLLSAGLLVLLPGLRRHRAPPALSVA